ncbi:MULTISPECIES: DUF4435 domain-containing protein [unclassified Pseudoalteromonas]|uniref:DUF4435 domain-containing protein n=1 Tax=unclassified Pseudoalteromonas TaxID=194690 RepID=UPI000C06FCD1|nr:MULTISPECIES: DUF4435 domain-containing protein [unclassified Pseudoalteromonas]MDP2635105.1 DUF4435 domain-containing protein [Pseudoalteromonas sp. 1_MG-2023]PHN91466.1 hypothetical protein CSC79_00010 [Pseudoalteromonas sp. 3D05]
MQGMQYDIDEIVTQSIMTNLPSVLVEGVDDIGVYDKILNSDSKISEIIAIETIEGYTKGCESVINATNYLESKNNGHYNYVDYLVGIIDKDVRDYRNELPENSLILPLTAYSIESHFVNSDVLDYLLRSCTKGNSELFTENLNNKLMGEIIESMELLYIASLDALKGALKSDYTSDFGYCQGYGRLKDHNLASKLYAKKDDLEEFAVQLSLSSNLETLKKICKGKWLLSVFCEELEKSIKSLPDECGTDPVSSCQMCISQAENSCLYRLMEGFTHKSMRSIAQRVTTTSELQYIRERVNTMYSLVA